MLENNVSGNLIRRNGVLGIFDLNGDIKVVEDSLEKGHRPDPFNLDVEQAVDRHIHPSEKCNEHRDVTDREVGIVLHHEDSACKIKQHRSYAREGRKDHSEPAACHALLDVKTDHPAVGFLVSLVLIFLFSEELYEELSADRKRLIQDAVYFVIYLL